MFFSFVNLRPALKQTPSNAHTAVSGSGPPITGFPKQVSRMTACLSGFSEQVSRMTACLSGSSEQVSRTTACLSGSSEQASRMTACASEHMQQASTGATSVPEVAQAANGDHASSRFETQELTGLPRPFHPQPYPHHSQQLRPAHLWGR